MLLFVHMVLGELMSTFVTQSYVGLATLTRVRSQSHPCWTTFCSTGVGWARSLGLPFKSKLPDVCALEYFLQYTTIFGTSAVCGLHIR